VTAATTGGGAPRFINPASIGAPIGAYSHVARTASSETYYVAGQVAVDRDGTLVGPGDLAAQLGQTFANIGSALTELGLSFASIALMTTYLTRREHVAEFYSARQLLFPSLFGEAMYPPNTLLIVAGLVRPELLIEVQVIATA
jgi:enamine deaminase RidA (YjgF/YER057c/UK114 family)